MTWLIKVVEGDAEVTRTMGAMRVSPTCLTRLLVYGEKITCGRKVKVEVEGNTLR